MRRVLTLKTQTPANIKFPGYLEYTISIIFIELPEYREKTHAWNANYANIYTYIYIYISEISIDMNRECARFARSIIYDFIELWRHNIT